MLLDDDDATKSPATKGCKSQKPLKLHDLLVHNVNTWGNVEYNVPLRSSSFETRTGTNVAHRHIPPVPYSMDCQIKDPLPVRVTGRDMVVEKETYRTTSGDYCVKPNPNKAMERADCAINCKRVGFMTGVEKRLQKHTIRQPLLLSEMKDNYRGVARSKLAPPDPIIKAPDPEYIFDVVAAGRNEAPCIPETAKGFRRLLDPYVTTYRGQFRPYLREDQFTCKNQITFYSESNTPKVKGFGPRHKEVWMPLQAKRYMPEYDRVQFKTEYKEVAAARNPVKNLIGVFESETKRKYQTPFAKSPLATWSNEESFDLAPYPPNPYQTNIAPFMYCSDYCHVAQGTPPCIVIDQFEHKLPAHRRCLERFVVSRDFTV